MKKIYLYLLASSTCLLRGMEQQKPNALHEAARKGDLPLIKDLVEYRGVDVNASISGGIRALHYAAQFGYLDIVSYLLCHGASIDVATREGTRPVHLAAKKGYVPVLRSLIQFRDKRNVDPDPNVQDMRGYTPLHYAAQNGHLQAVQYLHAWGACIDSVADHDKTPFALAQMAGHKHVVDYLQLTSHVENQPLRPKY